VLLQQRAATKPLFGGRWSNTVCTHPLPLERPTDAAHRRLREELGVTAALTRAGQFAYEALDPESGLSENEVDHVFVGVLAHDPTPDPAEVAAVRWIAPDALAEELAGTPEQFTPWLRSVLALAALERCTDAPGSGPAGAAPSPTPATEEPT
jgi:isopentenyl-diphosphate delta-isomerase